CRPLPRCVTWCATSAITPRPHGASSLLLPCTESATPSSGLPFQQGSHTPGNAGGQANMLAEGSICLIKIGNIVPVPDLRICGNSTSGPLLHFRVCSYYFRGGLICSHCSELLWFSSQSSGVTSWKKATP